MKDSEDVTRSPCFSCQRTKSISEHRVNDDVVVHVLQSVDETVELSMVMVMTKEEPTLQFEEKSRSIRCREDNHLCEKGNYETYGFVRGNQLYSTGIHHVRVRFEKTHSSPNWNQAKWSPWIFVGICSSTEKSASGDVRYHKLRSATGWSTNGDLWVNGIGKRIHWASIPIENDVLQLTIDCDKRTLSLLNERTQEKTHEIPVDLQDKTQFPWCFYLVIANQGYQVRLLPAHHDQPDQQNHHH